MRRYIVVVLFSLLFLSACMPTRATLDNTNKKSTKVADENFIRYRSKHPDSSRLADMTLELSKMHFDAGEYLLSDFYAKTYLSDYGYMKNADKAYYMHIKSLYARFRSNPSSDELAKQIKSDCKSFVSTFPKSRYKSSVRKISKDTTVTIKAKNEEIAKEYERLGKQKAAEFYRNKNRSL